MSMEIPANELKSVAGHVPTFEIETTRTNWGYVRTTITVECTCGNLRIQHWSRFGAKKLWIGHLQAVDFFKSHNLEWGSSISDMLATAKPVGSWFSLNEQVRHDMFVLPLTEVPPEVPYWTNRRTWSVVDRMTGTAKRTRRKESHRVRYRCPDLPSALAKARGSLQKYSDRGHVVDLDNGRLDVLVVPVAKSGLDTVAEWLTTTSELDGKNVVELQSVLGQIDEILRYASILQQRQKKIKGQIRKLLITEGGK